MPGPRQAAVVLVVLGAGFAAGTIGLLRTRYARGDVYPPYSSLRADPLGTRALHDALRDLPGIEVRRNLEDPGRLEGGPGLTVLILGMDEGAIRSGGDPVEALESLALGGSRVVVTLSSIGLTGSVPDKPEARDRPARDRPAPDPEPESDGPPSQRRRRPATLRWGFGLETAQLPRGDQDRPVAAQASRRGAGPGPTSVPWHSPRCFGGLAPAWDVIYEREGRPVLIERPFGGGRLILAGDSYFASNEALREDPRADLLVRLLGTPRTIVIDETHLGIAEAPGIVALARRYRLGPVVAVVAALAVLFIWRASAPLVPRAGDAGAEEAVVGRDAAEGLARLLQRGLDPSGVPRACIEEWRRSFGRSHATLAGALDRIRIEHRDPVEVCRDLHRLVARGKGDHER